MTHALYFSKDTIWTLPGQPVRCLLPLRADAVPTETLAAEDGTVALVDEHATPPLPDARPLDLRACFDHVASADYILAVRAFQWLNWRRTTRFCAVCGKPLLRHASEKAMSCPACGALFYPRINPVVIVRVTRDDTVLLERHVRSPTGFFSVVAGFVEAGETLEQALRREVAEEVGISVRNIRYFSSQPWSFPNNLMIAFTAEWAGGEVRPDGVEIGEAGWFTRDNLPTLPGPISISRRLIDAWLMEGDGETERSP